MSKTSLVSEGYLESSEGLQSSEGLKSSEGSLVVSEGDNYNGDSNTVNITPRNLQVLCDYYTYTHIFIYMDLFIYVYIHVCINICFNIHTDSVFKKVLNHRDIHTCIYIHLCMY
jgi:hypothetical protein